MRRRRRNKTAEFAAGAAAAIVDHPREFVAVLISIIAATAIVTNAVFLQKGPHPAPIFAASPLLQKEARLSARVTDVHSTSSVQARTALIAGIQRELARKGFYDGAADGIWGTKTDAAARDFIQASGLKINPEASDAFLRALGSVSGKPASPAATGSTHPAGDPIARLIAPSKRILAVQRALADFGYGQLKPTGIFDSDTKAAIEKFERDHRLPVSGQISDRFVRELGAMTGRPLE
ncbi:MAG TPA: peptidoglycan-binding domain-containing protein [Pseudolabrys sp.]|nr:peptidoglycan-binding domain-containing protein [Pseudolabrys sp.]